ncbi:hypothetical protein [Sphingomonas elodea]|uniref:hypothetical protein n=1 Tax=Sphingomonas elodea TaxID=179878 RepID=UPI0009FF1A1A|nr:hypothetical protein [Sphingomonas elodea]
MLAACGGGGSSAGGSVTTPVTQPTPTPTPTPAPSPTPTATYKTYDQLTGDQSYKTACAGLILSASPPTPIPASAFGDGLGFSYAAATSSHVITGNGLNLAFLPADRDPKAPAGVVAYAKPLNGSTELMSIARPAPGGTGFDYGRSFSLTTRNTPSGSQTQYLCVFGVPTQAADLPTSGTQSYTRIVVGGTAFTSSTGGTTRSYTLGKSRATLSADFAGRSVVLSIQLVGVQSATVDPSATEVDLGTYTATVPLDVPQNRFTGSLVSSDRSSLFSLLGGAFFGPQGSETMTAFEIVAVDTKSGDRITALGGVAAAR